MIEHFNGTTLHDTHALLLEMLSYLIMFHSGILLKTRTARYAGCALSKYTLTLSFIFLINQLISESMNELVYLDITSVSRKKLKITS